MKWEKFLDASYYDMWAVRPSGDTDFNSPRLFHFENEDDAKRFAELASKANTSVPPPSHTEELSREAQAIELLKGYEEFEAALIEDNALWWPQAMKDAVRGKTYDLMLELQAKRNNFLKNQPTPQPLIMEGQWKEVTAMQILINWVNDNGSNWESEADCKSILSKATELLAKEREQICDAWTDGCGNGSKRSKVYPSTYFTNTYTKQ